MHQYHKIQTVYKRDPETKFKTLLEGEYSLPEFEYLKNNLWVFTEKVDGTNIRVQYGSVGLAFKGKSNAAQIPPGLLDALQKMFTAEKMKEHFESYNMCLYGEGYGPKIQSGGKYRSDPSFVLFDVQVDGWWLERCNVQDIAMKLGIDTVPIIGHGTLQEMVEVAKKGFKSTWGDFQAEGIVARPHCELQMRNGERVITKIKCKDFIS